MLRYRRQCRQLVLEVLEQRRLLADDVDGGGTDALPLLPDDMTTVEENKPLRDDLTSFTSRAMLLDNNLKVVDLTDLTEALPLNVVATTQILWQTQDWEHSSLRNSSWPEGGHESLGFPAMVKNDHGQNPDGKYYLYYAHHDPMSGIGCAVADSIDGPYTKISATDSQVLTVPNYNPAGPHPHDPSHYSSPSVVWNDEEGLWFMYFHYYNHYWGGAGGEAWSTHNPGFGHQMTGLATTPDLSSHNWTIWTDPVWRQVSVWDIVPVFPTTDAAWMKSQSSYHGIQRLPDGQWLAFLRGTNDSTGRPTVGFATSNDGRHWDYFPENPVIAPGKSWTVDTNEYRPKFIGYLGENESGKNEYLVAWSEHPHPHIIYSKTTDFKTFERDSRGYAQWGLGDGGVVSPWREGDRLYLFSGINVHEMVLPVPTNFEPTEPSDLSARDVLETQATLIWGASSDADGDPVTYELQYRQDDLSDHWSSTLSTSSTSLKITGLEVNTNYRVRVRASDGQATSDWVETTKLFSTLPFLPTFAIGEFGTLTNITHVSQAVLLDHSYNQPVVLAQSASTNGQDATVVRVTNVQSNRFSIYLAESSAGNGMHSDETVTYLVVEAGTHQLADGTRLQAGTVTTNATVGELISNEWETVSLANDFFTTSPPVVLTQVQTDTGEAFLATRQNNVTPDRFDVALEPEEDNTTPHATETIGFLAIEAGTHATGSLLLEAHATPTSVTHDWHVVSFDRQYDTAPGLLSSLNSYTGSNNAHVRYQNVSSGGVELKIGEDISHDTEINHSGESVAYVAIAGSGPLTGTVAQREIGQVGVITNLTHASQTILLDRSFHAPVVFAQSPTAHGVDPVSVRIDNVQSDRFSIYLTEPSDQNNLHNTAETVTYLVLEAGVHELADGRRLEVGTRTTGASLGQLFTDQWETVAFDRSFPGAPVVLTQIQTVSDQRYLQTRQNGISTTGFQFALQQEQAIATAHVPETVGYLAIESGAGVWNGHVFEAASTAAMVTDAWTPLPFARRFPGVPALLTSLNTYYGYDSAHLRYDNLSDTEVHLRIGEDTTYDTEVAHGVEGVAYLAIGGTGLLTATMAQQEIGEVGTITNLTHAVQTILLDRSYIAPVVFAQSPTAYGIDPVTVRVDNVLSDRFSIYLTEPSDQNNLHNTPETVTYLVLEAGVHTLADGTHLEVGMRTTGATVGQHVTSEWEPVTWSTPFSSTPVVLTQIQTVSGLAYLQTRQTGSSATGFELALQQEEAVTTQHVPETVGYLAIDPGVGLWSSQMFEARNTPALVSESWTTVWFSEPFAQVPRLLTSLNGYLGRDSAHLRYDEVSENRVQLRLGEDTTYDAEIVHADESVAYLAIAGTGRLTATTSATPPVVTSVLRDGGTETYDTLDTLRFTWDQSVQVAATALQLRRGTIHGTLVNLSGVGFEYDAMTQTATWDFTGFNGWLPGAYSVILNSAEITTSAGVPLDGDGDGSAGGDFVATQIIAYRGDADRDRDVDIFDFNLLATSFDPLGSHPTNRWSQGNFDGDTDVDMTDFAMFVRNFSPFGYTQEAAVTGNMTLPVEMALAANMPGGSGIGNDRKPLAMASKSLVATRLVANPELLTVPSDNRYQPKGELGSVPIILEEASNGSVPFKSDRRQSQSAIDQALRTITSWLDEGN